MFRIEGWRKIIKLDDSVSSKRLSDGKKTFTLILTQALLALEDLLSTFKPSKHLNAQRKGFSESLRYISQTVISVLEVVIRKSKWGAFPFKEKQWEAFPFKNSCTLKTRQEVLN